MQIIEDANKLKQEIAEIEEEKAHDADHHASRIPTPDQANPQGDDLISGNVTPELSDHSSNNIVDGSSLQAHLD